ncbi:heavy metal-associated isoprenylated plant protein 6-like [Iris pallida]|uniref:Heavy metal-associated isoprenylated plant protein 6-like n=1 Tax=Iris pallida TaxID=29817 RepID=A0AAX6H293_IRIPA|nr:heavy metal-associated isoprenylated plant protein 6-like [Iris pallida]
MAPGNIMKELKGVNFSCSSPASTTTVDEQYSSSSPTLMSLGSSGRAIDRFSPHLRDPLRAKSLNPDLTQRSPTPTKPKLSTTSSPKNVKKAKEKAPAPQQQQQQLISPASSSRYLLSGSASDDLWHSPQAPPVVSEAASEARRFHRSAKVQQLQSSTVVKLAEEPSTFQSITLEQSTTTTPPPPHDPESSSSSLSSSSSSCSSSSTRPQNHQVVVLRVSLHCKGCEGKVRKHISKMEGVTSFTTDLVNKKVTVIGDVTPLGVLNSISKVKNAQLWRSLPPLKVSPRFNPLN